MKKVPLLGEVVNRRKLASRFRSHSTIPMTMPFSVAEDLQWSLFVMLRDDLSSLGFIGGLRPGASARAEWQRGVDLIYRLLSSELILMVGAGTEKSLEWFYSDLTKNDPFDQDESGVWMDQLLYASPLCKSLFAKHGIQTYDAPLCEALIEDIEALFEQHGVAWSDVPLIPIRADPQEG